MALSLCVAMFWGGGTHYWGPLESDLTNQFYPWRVFLHRWFTRGVFPFWDPHMFSGYPTVETQQMLNLNPFHLLSIFLKPEIGLTAFTALNTIIACAGMMYALRRWCRCSAMAAALGAGIYVFGALFAVRVMAGHITVVSALAWWPLAALSILRMTRLLPPSPADSGITREVAALFGTPRALFQNPRLRRVAAISSVAHAMVCLAGAPQYIVYLFYLDLAILAASARRWTWIASLAILAGVWVLALVVSAPQWLPAMWYLPYSGRALSSGGTTGISLGPMTNIILEMVMPFPFGDDLNHGHLHFKNVWETATYPGGIALILSLTVVIRSLFWRFRQLVKGSGNAASVTPLAVAATVILLLGFYMMIGGWLPGFSSFREPLKARALVAFGFALASAAVFDHGILRAALWTKSLWAGVIGFGILLGNAGGYTGTQTFKALVETFGSPMDPLAAQAYNQFLANPDDAALRYFVAFTAGSLGLYFVLLLLVVKRPMRWVISIILFYAALGDPLFHHARSWLARYPWERADLPAPLKDYFKPRLEATSDELPWRVILNSSIINRTHHLEGLYEYHGYDPLMPAHGVGRMLVKGVRNNQSEDQQARRKALLQRVGVRYDATAWWPVDRITTGPPVVEVSDAYLFDATRNVAALALAPGEFGPDLSGVHYVVPGEHTGITQQPDLPEEFIARIKQTFPQSSPTTPPGEMITLSYTPLNSGTPQPPNNHIETRDTMQMISEGGRPDTWRLRVHFNEPTLVVFKTTWLPGWRAEFPYVDQDVPVLKANGWMPAVIAPAGWTEVVFRYRPVGWGASLLLAGAGVIALIGIIWLSGRKKQ